MAPADLWDDAEGAAMVAALRNFQVGAERIARFDPRRRGRRQQMSRARIRNRPQLRPFATAKELGKIEKIAGADENIDLGKLLAQLAPVALRKTSRHHQPLAGSVRF